MARAMLIDERDHGITPCGGGLAINWKPVGNAIVFNSNSNGVPDATPCTRHEDRMTTLRFLHGMLLYRKVTGTAEFDTAIGTFTTRVLGLFEPKPDDKRGWAWNELMDIGSLSHDSRFFAVADKMSAGWYQALADSSRPDYQFTEASALAQSQRPEYQQHGRQLLDQLWSADFDPVSQLIREPSVVKASTQGDIAVALVRAGMVSRAKQILAGMQAMIDPTHGGYCESATNNTDGTLKLNPNKTGGRMMNMLLLGKLLGDQDLVRTVGTLFTTHIYRSQPVGYEGVLYEQSPDWSLLVRKGIAQDWVTSEAIGITVEALLA